MWKRLLLLGALISLPVFIPSAYAVMGYGGLLCQSDYYNCIQVHEGDTWDKLFPDPQQRDFVMHLNRLNIRLFPGMKIAVPKNGDTNLMDFSPFATHIEASGGAKVIVDPKFLAWGAYDADGNLLRWGPASAGSNYCADLGRGCRTKPGDYTVYDERGAGCKSSIFPLEHPGAPMPYCMFFHGGMALHGSYEVPGFNDSHGCVRLFPGDAEWLNHDFVHVGGTRVEVLQYASHGA